MEMTPAPISVERLPAKWRKWADGLYRAEPANRIRDCADDLEAALPALLQQLAELSADRDGWKRIAESAIRDHEAAERAREEAELVLQNARTHLPRKVQTTQLGDWDAEQCSIFDNGYNAALTKAHNLLNMPADAIRKATARDAAFLAASGGK